MLIIVIVVKGSSLTRVGSKEDFTVTIGNASCMVMYLTSNQLTYMPPKMKPPSGPNKTCSSPDLNDVVVGIQPTYMNNYNVLLVIILNTRRYIII